MPARSEFDREIALEPAVVDSATGADPSGVGTYRGTLGEGWRIGGGINGGLLLALAGHALRRELGETSADGIPGHSDPMAISAYFLTPGVPGAVTVRTEAVRRGRAVSTGQATLLQDDGNGGEVERVRVLATYGDLASVDGDVRTTAAPPQLPDPDACVSADQAPPDFLEHASLLQRLDMRLDPATVGWAMGKPSGKGEIRGWLRMADGREPDPLLLLLAVDALPPVSFDLGMPGWTPTLELTAHVRCRPAPGWLRVNLTSRTLSGGYLEEDAEVWDSEDRLVALSRQLARATSPRR